MNPGIETKIDGITYRSLLEAKWAVFLAALEIPVLYEPFELAGYIPGHARRPLHPSWLGTVPSGGWWRTIMTPRSRERHSSTTSPLGRGGGGRRRELTRGSRRNTWHEPR